MNLPTIILLRHGETKWNVEGRYQGQLNSPLTQKGKLQAKMNASKIEPYLALFDSFRFVSSPLGRAKETALIVANYLSIDNSKIEYIKAIEEFDYGKFEGKTKKYCQEVYREEYEAREIDKWSYIIEGGESYDIVTKRLRAWLQTLNHEEPIIMVAHEMINRALRGIYTQLDKKSTLILRQPNDVVLKLENGLESIVN
jgi:probable phosphoglycerate mutase